MKPNLILAKVFKFATFVLFTFMALVYFGVLLLLPLDIVAQLARLLYAIGLPSIISVLGGVGALGYVGLKVWNMPELYNLLIGIGLDLINFGREQMKRFDPLIESAKGGESAA